MLVDYLEGYMMNSDKQIVDFTKKLIFFFLNNEIGNNE
jgi:hypothetical protein